MDIAQFRVKPGSTVDLDDWDPNENGGFDRAEAEAETGELNTTLERLQETLYAENKHRVLIVLQATDTGGKDGTIRAVFEHVNPQGVKVASFKRPTSRELAHDYLWRVHPHVPGNGEIVIFNRSHYEDVLVVRVHDYVPKKQWKKRYDHIKNFEQLLVDEGTKIIKLYLHISKDEQAERLQSRLDEPHKHWKFERGDLAEREHWDEYQEAFREMLERTSTEDAPWFVIPANRKWFRNRVISQIIVDALEELDPQFPEADDLSDVVIT